MSDLLERLAATVREWQETRLVPGKEADAVLNAAPEIIAVARAFRELLRGSPHARERVVRDLLLRAVAHGRREALEEAAGVLEAKRAVSERARQRTPADSTKTWNYYNVRCVAFGEAAHDLRALIGGKSNTGHASYDAAYQDRHTTMERPTWGECSECGVAIAWEDRPCPQCEGSEG